jgi:hypothetical protein
MARDFTVKTYVVLQRMNVPTANGDNVRVVDVCLTAAAAERVVDRVPGTFVDRHNAHK